jgi:Holliday junction resolvasome RuvABC ATP-dependent DNA helicase subunit
MNLLANIIEQMNSNVENEGTIIDPKEEVTSMEVVLKAGQFDVNKIIPYENNDTKKFEFRPQTWEQFVGQKEAKERAKTLIKKHQSDLKSHFLVDGIKGHGKTTFVELFAKSIDAHIIKRIGKQINVDNLVEIINEINICENNNVVFFIDEMDTCDWQVVKVLNPIIESFEIAGKKIKPFIFAGATINKHKLIDKNPDTLDRIPTHIKFQRYDKNEIHQIIKQYIIQLYSKHEINDDIINQISKNCKFNPRTSVALLEEYIVEQNIDKVLKNCNIIIEGLTNIDIHLLKILNESSKAIGCNALAQKCGLSQNEYIREFEPYLVEYDYINRIPSRQITEKGKELLQQLKGEE